MKKSKSNQYIDAGVNIDRGNELVKRIKKNISSTHIKGSMKNFGLFGGFFDISNLGYKQPILISSADGVGTKLQVAKDLKKYDSIGIDLVAMCMNDVLVHGAKPIFFLDYIALEKLNISNVQKIINGICLGCKQAKCSLLGGETAEMPGLYKKNDFDLAGFGVGIVEKKNIITGKKIKYKDAIIGLKSSGFHSNGYSLIRHVLKKKKVKYNHKVNNQITNLGKFLLKPTKIYSEIILKLNEKNLLSGISHITGGGIIDNIPRILPKNLSVNFQDHKWDLPYIFRWFANLGNIGIEEMLRVFNCGIGMVLFCNQKNEKKLLEVLKKNKESFVHLGYVSKNKKKIDIENLKKTWEI